MQEWKAIYLAKWGKRLQAEAKVSFSDGLSLQRKFLIETTSERDKLKVSAQKMMEVAKTRVNVRYSIHP